jgi:hypothetical protein
MPILRVRCSEHTLGCAVLTAAYRCCFPALSFAWCAACPACDDPVLGRAMHHLRLLVQTAVCMFLCWAVIYMH